MFFTQDLISSRAVPAVQHRRRPVGKTGRSPACCCQGRGQARSSPGHKALARAIWKTTGSALVFLLRFVLYVTRSSAARSLAWPGFSATWAYTFAATPLPLPCKSKGRCWGVQLTWGHPSAFPCLRGSAVCALTWGWGTRELVVAPAPRHLPPPLSAHSPRVFDFPCCGPGSGRQGDIYL